MARLHEYSNRYLVTILFALLTAGVVLALYGIQQNSNEDTARSIKADKDQAIAFCHSINDNNQAIRDTLSILSIDTKVTDDMTPSQKESIRIANERRKGYRLIVEDLFQVNPCSDGYKPNSKQDELRPILQPSPGTTVLR